MRNLTELASPSLRSMLVYPTNALLGSTQHTQASNGFARTHALAFPALKQADLSRIAKHHADPVRKGPHAPRRAQALAPPAGASA